MKSFVKIAFICLFVCLKINISAQTNSFRFGVQAGLNLSTALVNDAAKIELKPGYQLGATVKYPLSQNFQIQSGLLFSAKGSIIESLKSGSFDGGEPNFTHTFNQFYLELPLYVTYKIKIAKDLNVVWGIGPYLGYGIGGKTKHKLNDGIWGNGATEREWNTFGDGIFDKNRDWLRGESLNRFDLGAGIKVDLEYQKYVLGIGFTSSIIDIMKKQEYSDLHYRNLNINISMGYKF